jgi:hypothetical protein
MILRIKENKTMSEQTLPALVDELGITLKIRHRAHPNKVTDWQAKANCYRVTLNYEGRSYSLYFYQGTGITRDPSVSDLIACLASDYSILTSCDTLKCFGDCMGWDENTADTYRAIKRQSARYSKLIGNPATLELIGSIDY